MKAFIPIFKKRYDSISAKTESVDIQYYSDLNKSDMNKLLSQNLERDKVLQYTSIGLHKDDLDFVITEVPIKNLVVKGSKRLSLLH